MTTLPLAWLQTRYGAWSPLAWTVAMLVALAVAAAFRAAGRKDAAKGRYRILANYYASHRQALTGAATVTATVYTGWGTDTEKRETFSFRLDKPKDKHPIGEVEVGE